MYIQHETNDSYIVYFCIAIIVLAFMSIPVLTLISKRNDEVLKFEFELIKLCHEYNMRHIDDITLDPNENAFTWCNDELPSYTAKVFSFKKLTLENYIPPEKLKKLMN